MPDAPKNLAASVRARLLNHAREREFSFELVLTRYALERLLYRLSRSKFAHRFVLKGAMLMMTWFEEPHRGTGDLDLLGFGDPNPDALITVFREIMATEEEDGLVFDVEGLRADAIREDVEYGGVRLRTIATLEKARIAVTIDIGFGDAIEPGAVLIDYPALLDMPAPRLRAYARETVIAEKFQAMVALGRANSRMKDFYDIWVLSSPTSSTRTGSRRPSPPPSSGAPPRCQRRSRTHSPQSSPRTLPSRRSGRPSRRTLNPRRPGSPR
jgi:predicted nucleotidyltransferase component of viral defense system